MKLIILMIKHKQQIIDVYLRWENQFVNKKDICKDVLIPKNAWAISCGV